MLPDAPLGKSSPFALQSMPKIKVEITDGIAGVLIRYSVSTAGRQCALHIKEGAARYCEYYLPLIMLSHRVIKCQNKGLQREWEKERERAGKRERDREQEQEEDS